ncbi:ABC transporter substrate-binding protein [Neptuniibacter sp. QD29_5]|uniref:ABC transporter substrate-binding protein n=1 Tax=Neptuniibacter sp. QD29_5 TaxID=3398207 RepID=UPI0039F4C35D
MFQLPRKFSLIFLLLSFITGAPAAYADTFKVGYFISRTADDMFYGPVVGFMQAAANDLGVELHIIEANDDHLLGHEKVRELLFPTPQLDAIIAISVKESGARILKLSEPVGVPVFIENSAILDKAIGSPRQHFQHYIGEMLPDDEMAGYELAKYLIQRSRKSSENSAVNMVAISGPYGTSASIQRERGLQRAIEEFSQTNLLQIVRANWERDRSRKTFKKLIQRYPSIDAVWTASDGMALGVFDALTTLAPQYRKNIIVGGVDWSREGVEGVDLNQIQATAGGHFMEGAWALIVVYDFLNGHDFMDSEGLKMKTNMSLITKENFIDYAPLIDRNNWKKINFKSFSKTYNPVVTHYNFELKSVLDALDLDP